MSKKQLLIQVNIGIVVVLAYQYFKGINLFTVVIAGIVSFAVLNAVVLITVKARDRRRLASRR